MKRIIAIIALLVTLVGVTGVTSVTQAAMRGDWVLYPTYDANTYKIIDTPERTYFLGYAHPYVPSASEYSDPVSFLFFYDKGSDEIQGLTKRAALSENIVATAEYNPEKGYLLVVYSNSNIDLIYDSGEVYNIPGLMSAVLPSSKRVNNITFYPSASQAWLATDFGYICINDDKHEIAESRNYGTALESVARMGDYLLLTRDGKVYEGKVSEPNFNLSDFAEVESYGSPAKLLPLADNMCGVFYPQNGQYVVTLLTRGRNGYGFSEIAKSYRNYLTPNRDGYMLASSDNVMQIRKDGTRQTRSRLADDNGKVVGTWDFAEMWYVDEREGFYSRRYTDGSGWTLTRGHMQPNAPAPFLSQEIASHPEYGILVSNHGTNSDFPTTSVRTPIVLSGLQNGEWTKYGPAYNYPAATDVLWNPNGMAIDPDNSNYVYFGSVLNGMVRINLADAEDILHMSHPGDATAGLPGFVAVVPDKTTTSNYKFSAPQFDADGNLWTGYYNHDATNKYEIWVWLSADRKASKDAASFREWKKLSLPYKSTNYDILLPLRSSVNRGLVIASGNEYDGPLLIIDTNGTPGDQSDDRVVTMTTIEDQDGSAVDHHYIKALYEDTSTGTVWVGTTTGVFTIQPRTAMENPSRVTRIKVAREDGTDLADYLLDGVELSRIIDDGQGRKWFATKGAGLVCTSSDGRTILGEFTAENSWLPSNVVYGVGYDQASNSVMVSTLEGLAQYFPTGGGSSTTMDEVRVYPNPVRPDYFGYVTIDGLTEGALVKISDSAGNLVKELGRAEGGQVQWDVTNHTHERVKTGVYFVLASSGPGDTNLANVSKVLVIN